MMTWELEYQLAQGALPLNLATLLTRLLQSTDAEMANDLMGAIEYEVAPPSGGIGRGATAVAFVICSNLPIMPLAARASALSLLASMASSAGLSDDPEARAVSVALVNALPFLSGIAQRGDEDQLSEFVDLASLCADLDPTLSKRVLQYLTRICDFGGAVAASALREIEEVRKLSGQ